MSNYPGGGLVAAIKRFQDAVDRFDAAAAAALGINGTDLRALTALNDRGPLTASVLAIELGLTRSATTTALDRLEAAGYIERRPHAADGRSFVIALTAAGSERVRAIWQPMRERGGRHLARYTSDELAFLVTFFERSTELQETCREELLMRAPLPTLGLEKEHHS